MLAVVGLGATAVHLGLLPASPAVSAAAPSAQPAPLGMPHPTPGGESADVPLGTPLPAPAEVGEYGFVQFQADGVTPVGYDPCRPIHYAVRPDNAPAGGEQVIQDAVARISEVTGFRFIDDGPTDEPPNDQREPYQPDRYGDRWAPVLVTWDTVAEQPGLAGDVAGLGGSQSAAVDDGPRVFVTGGVELDAAEFTELLSWPDGQAVARAVVLHELGHVLGLAHVSDPGQLMYPTQSGVWDFAAGDLAGLARLSAGACAPDL